MENKMEKRYGLPTAISMVIGIVIGSCGTAQPHLFRHRHTGS